MSNKNIYVTRAFLPPLDEYVEGLKQIWDSAILTNQGPIHNRLIEELKHYLSVERLALFVNGHQALDLTLKALKLKGEVITTPFSFASTTHAIVQNGLKPVFGDIRSSDYNLDETKIEALITENTCAILPVHVYGNPCNIEKIGSIAKQYNLKVIYDAAHAFGVKVDGIGIGNFGDVSMFSFHATKVFNTIEGGALSFTDPGFEHSVNLLKNFGIAGPEDVVSVGTNAKLNEFQALMGVLNLKYMDREIALREEKVRLYRQLLSCVPGVHYLEYQSGVKANYAYFPVLIDEKTYGFTRDYLFEKLAESKIHARKYFYPLITEYVCYKGLFHAELPNAKYVADRIITLPIWGEISIDTIEEICSIVRETHRLG